MYNYIADKYGKTRLLNIKAFLKLGDANMNNKHLVNKTQSIKLFLILFTVHAVIYMTKNMFSAAMATIVEEGVMTKSQTGTISALFWIVYAISQIIGGFAADKYSPSKLIIIGLVGGIISNLIIYINHNYWVIVTVWCINAAFQFGLWPGVFKIVSTQLSKSIRSTAILWILFSTATGQALSMLLASIVKRWYYNFIISAIVLTLALVLWIIGYKKAEKHMVESNDVEYIESQSDKKHEIKSISIKELSIISGLPILLMISLLVQTVNQGVKMVTPLMLTESYENLSAAIATRMSVILIIFSSLGTIVANSVRKYITKNEIKAVILLSTVSILPLAFSYFVGKLQFFAILAFLSLAVTLMQTMIIFTNSFTAIRFERYGRVGMVSGILNAVASVANFIASYVFPKLSETMPWNNITILWTITTICILVSSLCIVRLWTSFIKAN